jgi:hypothetical protein
MLIGLRPTDWPISRAVVPSATAAANSPYVIVSPYGMVLNRCQIRRWRSSPFSLVGRLKPFRRPAR